MAEMSVKVSSAFSFSSIMQIPYVVTVANLFSTSRSFVSNSAILSVEGILASTESNLEDISFLKLVTLASTASMRVSKGLTQNKFQFYVFCGLIV